MKKGNSFKDKLNTRQFRNMSPIQTEEKENVFESDFYVEGYAARFEPYVLYEDEEGQVKELFTKEAFNESDMSDIILLYDHQGKVLARTSNNTLKVTLDDEGMFVQADLSKSAAAKEMYNEIQNGLINKMSWSFKTGQYHFEKETRTIVHDEVQKVYDVSAVGIPANNDTNINARNFGDGVIEEVKAERLKEQERRKKLLLKLKIEGAINE